LNIVVITGASTRFVNVNVSVIVNNLYST